MSNVIFLYFVTSILLSTIGRPGTILFVLYLIIIINNKVLIIYNLFVLSPISLSQKIPIPSSKYWVWKPFPFSFILYLGVHNTSEKVLISLVAENLFNDYVLSESSGRPTFLLLIWFLTIIFVRIEIQSFLKFLQIEVSDGSGGVLSSGSPSGSNSPDDWGRMYAYNIGGRMLARSFDLIDELHFR